MTITVGTRVRIERGETRYPSKGTWPRFRGKTGTIVEINLGEYGVSFGKVTPRTDGRGSLRWDSRDVAWFQPYELAHTGRPPQRAYEPATAVPDTTTPAKELAHV